MKFSTREDIAAPIDYVFAEISDFNGFERSAMRRGAEVRRIDKLAAPGTGMCWQIGFGFRGKHREIKLDLVEYDPTERLKFTGMSSGLVGNGEIELVALSPKKTRIRLQFELLPQSLSARLLIQSLKLAKGNFDKRLQMRVADYAEDVGARYARKAVG